MKRYNMPHRSRVIKTRLTEEEYTEFSERVTLCQMSQAEFIRQALIKISCWLIPGWKEKSKSFNSLWCGKAPAFIMERAAFSALQSAS